MSESPRSPIQGSKILLMGPGGVGKTWALRTLAAAGVTPFVLSLDPTGLESISDVPDATCHWHTIAPVTSSWGDLIKSANLLGALTYEGITKTADYEKSKQRRFINVLETLSKFTCNRCNQDFGMVDSWGTNRAIVIDHFTELSQASKEWAVGSKLVLHEGEWQVAMNNIENFVRNLTLVCRCWVILIAHIDRETDFLIGGTKIMVATLGKRLAPKLPVLFSDVILAKRIGKEFTWDTASPEVDLKTRNLPIEAKLQPDFRQIVEKWQSRGGIIET